jgi:hypothetical protein
MSNVAAANWLDEETEPTVQILIQLTCFVIILAAGGAAYETIRQNIAAATVPFGSLGQTAYTNASAAHVVLTNTTATTRYSCFRGVVKAASGKFAPIYTGTVCSGDLKPHSTVALEAPYDPGAVEGICSGPPNSLGMRNVDWDLCTFELEQVPAS